MELTKQEAIKNHREMWNWIAKQYENGSCKHINVLKEEYLYKIKIEKYMCCDCYCCEYADNINNEHRCYSCPLVWTEEDVKNEDVKNEDVKNEPYFLNKPYYCMNTINSVGLFEQLEKLTDVYEITNFEYNRIEIIRLAKQIAELKERKDV